MHLHERISFAKNICYEIVKTLTEIAFQVAGRQCL